jgi:hypothetical protein
MNLHRMAQDADGHDNLQLPGGRSAGAGLVVPAGALAGVGRVPADDDLLSVRHVHEKSTASAVLA